MDALGSTHLSHWITPCRSACGNVVQTNPELDIWTAPEEGFLDLVELLNGRLSGRLPHEVRIMEQPWECGPPLSQQLYAQVLRRAIFECCKWHTQAEDRPVLCPFPLILNEDIYRHLAQTAERLAEEALA